MVEGFSFGVGSAGTWLPTPKSAWKRLKPSRRKTAHRNHKFTYRYKEINTMTVSLKQVQMKSGTTQYRLDTPYNPAALPRLRALGGKWDASQRAWYFPLDLEAQLRQLCLDLFGIDPLATESAPTFSVHVDLSLVCFDDTLYLFGRPVLNRPSRDIAVKPGTGVSIVAGGFRPTGGSSKYPAIGEAANGTIILVRGVTQAAIDQAIAQDYIVTVVNEEETAKPERSPRDGDGSKRSPASTQSRMAEAVDLVNRLRTVMAALTEEERRAVVATLTNAENLPTI
jgi:hypothetical protein